MLKHKYLADQVLLAGAALILDVMTSDLFSVLTLFVCVVAVVEIHAILKFSCSYYAHTCTTYTCMSQLRYLLLGLYVTVTVFAHLLLGLAMQTQRDELKHLCWPCESTGTRSV